MGEKFGGTGMTRRVAVTGAGGYLGRHVVASLLDMGASVLAVDRVTPDVDPRAEVLVTDVLGGLEDPYQLFGDPDVVVHLAWRNGFSHNDESHLADLPKHYSLLKDLFEGGLKQVAVMGTMHEVGYYEGPISEDTPCNPASLYGIAKNALRQSSELLADKQSVAFQWIRGFYIVGDDRHNNSVFAKLLNAVDEGKSSFPFNSGKNLYDFISIDRIADQIAAVAMQDQVVGVINACSGEPRSLADQVEQYIQDHDLAIQLDYGAFPDRPYDSPGVWGDPTKINRVMGSASAGVPEN